MDDLDRFIAEEAVPMRKRVVDALVQKHPHIFGMLNMYLGGKPNKVGLRVTENGTPIRDYTFHLNGLHIDNVEYGVLASEIHHPFGAVKPYGVIEKDVLKRMIDDEDKIINEPFSVIRSYLPDFTIKFLR